MGMTSRPGDLLAALVWLVGTTGACTDPDEDGVPGVVAPFFDNCPTVWNPDQLNSDLLAEQPPTAPDLLGDACDECPHDEQARYAADHCVNDPTYREFSALNIDSRGCGCEEETGESSPSPFVSGGDVWVEQPIPSPRVLRPGLCVWQFSSTRVPGDECVPSPPPLPCDIEPCPQQPIGASVIERTCTAEGLTEETIPCPFGCSDGACACTEADTDRGYDPYNFGSIPGGPEDGCVLWVDLDNDGNYESSDTRMRVDACTEGDPDLPGSICGLEEQWLERVGDLCEPGWSFVGCDRELGCSAGACACVDPDRGSPYDSGAADGCDGDVLVEQTRQIIDAWCEEQLERIACGFGCVGGECICADSDVGKNPYMAGATATADADGCVDGNTLAEYSSNQFSDGGILPGDCRTPVELECPHGCEDGACQPPEGAGRLTVACVPAFWDPLDEARFDSFCQDEFARFVRASRVGEHASFELLVTHEAYEDAGVADAEAHFFELREHAEQALGADVDLVVGVTPDAGALEPILPTPGEMGRASLANAAAFVAYSRAAKYLVAHELAHLIARREGDELFYVCDEYDIDAWSAFSDRLTCVNGFPVIAEAFRQDRDCGRVVEDGFIGRPPNVLFCPEDDCLCAGHQMVAEELSAAGLPIFLRDIMGPVQESLERNLRMEFDPQTIEHLGRWFDEL
jgi:hypothetical protein